MLCVIVFFLFGLNNKHTVFFFLGGLFRSCGGVKVKVWGLERERMCRLRCETVRDYKSIISIVVC